MSLGAHFIGVTGVKITTLPFFFLSSDAFDNELVMQTLRKILQGETVQIPVYDFVTHSR